MTAEQKQIYTRRITQAYRTQLVTILYEMVLDYVADARKALAAGNVEELDHQLQLAGACIDELIHSLDMKYEIAQNLLQLYLFAKKELIAGGAARKDERIAHCEPIFRELHDTWQKLESMDLSQAEMSNAQTVMAGMTYGRHDVNENISGLDGNRGFTV